MRTLFRKSFGSNDSQANLVSTNKLKKMPSGSDINQNIKNNKTIIKQFSVPPLSKESAKFTIKFNQPEVANEVENNPTYLNDDLQWKKRFQTVSWHMLEGHTSDVNGVEFVGSRLLISCSNDKTIRVWRMGANDRFAEAQASPGQPVQSPLLGHAYGVNAVRVSPFGTILTSASTDGRVILWNTQTGSQSAALSQPSEGALRCLSFSPSSALLASGGDDESVCLWDLSSRALLCCLTGPEAMISCVSFSSDSQLLVAGSSGGELWFWYAQGVKLGEKASVIQAAHDLGVLGLEFAPNEEIVSMLCNEPGSSCQRRMLLATCGNDDLVCLWFVLVLGSIDSHVQVRKFRSLRGHTSNVNSCRFSSDSRLLASASGDKSIIIWSVLTGSMLVRLEAHQRYVTCVAFSADNRLLASGSNDQKVIVWGLAGQTFDNQVHNGCGDDLDQDQLQMSLNMLRRGTEKVSDTSHWQADNGDDLMHWSLDQVLQWLQSVGMHELQDTFKQQQIDGKQLLHLTHDTLQHKLKIESITARNRLLRMVQGIRNPLWQQLSSTADWSQRQVLPDELICPITHEPMKDPVVAHDGYSYERSAIEQWFNDGNMSSPMTNVPLLSKQLVPNYNLKTLIRKYIIP